MIHQINSYFGTDHGIEVGSKQLFSEPAEEVRARALKRLRSGSLEAPLAGAAAAVALAGGMGGVAALLGGDLPSDDETDASYTSEGTLPGLAYWLITSRAGQEGRQPYPSSPWRP